MISAATPEVGLATYKRQQTMLERQKRLNFLAEIQFQATTECDNSTHLKRQKLIHQLRGRGYNKNCILYPRT